MWIRNTDGKPDAIFTLSLLAFFVVLIKFMVAGVTFTISGVDYSLGSVDASMIAALLTPTLGAYVGRRYTDRKYQPAEITTSDPGQADQSDPPEQVS